MDAHNGTRWPESHGPRLRGPQEASHHPSLVKKKITFTVVTYIVVSCSFRGAPP